MSRLLERHAASIERRLVLLAPEGAKVPRLFRGAVADGNERSEILRAVQRLRGSVYVAEGALQPHQLDADGRHVTREDDHAWHMVTRDGDGEVTACSWYLEYPGAKSIYDVRARHCPLNKTAQWRHRLQAVIATEMQTAHRSGIPFAEVGGWAVAPGHRCSGDGLIHVFVMFSLSISLGGAIGLTTATVRHSSAAMLRRMGMEPLEANGYSVPTYYDPSYQCDMELLRFDTRRPSPQYVSVVDTLRGRLGNVSVFASDRPEVVDVAAALHLVQAQRPALQPLVA